MRPALRLAACSVVLGIAAAFVLLPGGAAGASQTSPGATTPSFICSQSKSSATPTAASYLPINRWASAASTQHSRLSLNLFNVGNLPNLVQRDFIVGDSQALGNIFWQAGVGLTEDATKFCFGTSVATTSDKLTAKIGQALANGGVIAVLLVAAAILIFFRLRRGDRNARQQIAKIVVVCVVFAVMVNGATQTRTNPTGSVSFGFGSPGWVITHVYNAASTVASAPAAALSGIADHLAFGSQVTSKIDSEDPLSCGNYVNNLRTDYTDSYGSTGASQMDATVPLALDSMWEQSGLTTYAYSQFGAGNDYADLVYCRLLEANANIPPKTQVRITDQTPGAAAILAGTVDKGGTTTAMAWASDQNLGASPDDTADESMIGWAACQTSSTGFTPMEWSSSTGAPVVSEWTKVVDPNATGSVYGSTGTVTPKLCAAFFDHAFKGLGPQGTALEWSDNTGQIATAANGPGGPYPGFSDYVTTLHGTSNGPAETLSIMFLISSAVDLLVFGIMAGAVFIAKFALLFIMAFAALLILISLWPGTTASSRLAAVAKHAFSMILFVTGAQIILSIVAITTSIIMDTGIAVAGQGTFLSLLWMGIAPIAAIFIIHHLFKQVLKAPSPFKLSSALAWGAASGGLGAGVVAGIDRISSRKTLWSGAQRARSALQGPRAALGHKQHAMEPAGSAAQHALGDGKSANGTKAPAVGAGEGADAIAGTAAVAGLAGGAASAAGAPAAVTGGHAQPAPAAAHTSNGSSRARPATSGAQRGSERTDGIGADGVEGTVADAEVVGGAVAGATTIREILRSRLRRRTSQHAAVGGGQAGQEPGQHAASGSSQLSEESVAKAYQTSLKRTARWRPGWHVDSDGVLRDRRDRLVGAARAEHGESPAADVRSHAQRMADDRALRRTEIRAGRMLDREALGVRASTNLLNRFAGKEHATVPGQVLGKVAGAVGNPETRRGRALQKVAERTKRAAQEFRAKPVRQQLKSVAKVGALGLAATALAASPVALGVAAGAYALHRAHKARFGLDAAEARNQQRIATFRAAAAASRQRRQAEATQESQPEPKEKAGESHIVENQESTEQAPIGEPPSDIDDSQRDWVPPEDPAAQRTQRTAAPRRAEAAQSGHQAPKSKAEVLRNDTHGQDAAPQAIENAPHTPSHLVGNRVANRPPEQTEMPPEVRDRFDAMDESWLDSDPQDGSS